MADLLLHGTKVRSAFQLLGNKENDISYSVAWALAQSPTFLRMFLRRVIDLDPSVEGVQIRLQEYETKGGITDIEIEAPQCFYLIAEAKRGWALPGRKQLEKYARRPSFCESKAGVKRLVVLSECSQEYAEAHLEISQADGIPIEPVSWKTMAAVAGRAHGEGTNIEKRLLAELVTYLRGLMTMQKVDSNWVYVVSLNSSTRKGWGISWIDIVRRKFRYFHPVGGSGWPKEPPNYIAFRYDGKLQSIHHIESYEVFTNPHKVVREIPDDEWGPHFLYKLGPAFGPAKVVHTGKIYPSGRVRCMLDTLFNCDSISEARDVSRERDIRGSLADL